MEELITAIEEDKAINQGLNLRSILTKATPSLEKKYKDHHDVLQLWLDLVDYEWYSYLNNRKEERMMGGQRIGLKHADFYLKWAEYEVFSTFIDRAKRILQAAIQSKVQPIGQLEAALLDLEKGVIKSRKPLQVKEKEETVEFKPRRRARLGPPARQPKLEVNQERGFPSPESISGSPRVAEIKDSQEEKENLIEIVKEDRSVNMDMSNTITEMNSKNYQVPVRDAEDKSHVVVNGKSYLRHGLIGKGGSCKVFKIEDEKDGSIYALKKVKLRGQDKFVVEGYKNEIILLNKLKTNERIIRLVDAIHDPDQHLLMMVLEYGEIDLEKMLQKNQETALSINFIRNYWEQMLQAVQAIHDQNIIHSDLKPANFLLVGGCLKLIDFGIAKAIPNDTTNIQRDHQSGTVNYMAPEAINYVEIGGTKQNYLKQGRASDVWSLACILYRFIYCHPPFGKMALMVKIHAITNPLHLIPYPQTDFQEVVSILVKCLVFEPKRRLTIPELLNHSFLKSTGKLTPESIEKMMERALRLGLDQSNFRSVVNRIKQEFL